jgi:CDP-diacylglycerol--glycerol-3-phosphate 3-phosphatidyltransferase
MTTANKVTILRICLTPLFIVETLYYFSSGEEWDRIVSLVCFAVASILDGVDGYIARHYNQKSELGAILDPLADKLLLVSAVVLLSLKIPSALGIVRIPMWVTVTIISRDLIILMGMFLVHMICGKVTVRPRIAGKIATVLQMAMVIWRFLKWDDRMAGWIALGAGIFTALSGAFYIWDGMRQLSSSPHSLPKPQQ